VRHAAARPDLPTILGADVAGTIEEVGAGVLDFAPGNEVYGCAGAPHGLPITHQQQLNAYIVQLNQAHVFDGAIVTKTEPGRDFYPVEDYHQDFLTRNPNYPYIVVNDLPLYRRQRFAKNRGPEAPVSRPLSHDACALLGPLCLTPRLPLLAFSLTVSIRGRTYCLAGGPAA
jgi:hypothetical protein